MESKYSWHGQRSGLLIRRHLVRIAFVSIIVITFGFVFWRKSEIPKFRPPPQLLPSGPSPPSRQSKWMSKRCKSDKECKEGFFCDLDMPRCEPLILGPDAPNANKPATVFDLIYEINYWGSRESFSGAGSGLYSTKHVRRCLGEWIQKYNIKSFGDICGDANWQAHIPGIHDIEYVGYDVAENALTRAREKNAQYGFKFQFLDVSASPPPKHDAFMIRD
eukprot:Selendium_serpulae@DN2741_c0_g1_i1.p1